MSHKAKALILHCIDFRFQTSIQTFLADKGLVGEVDVVSVAGSAKNYARPSSESDKEFLLRQIDISVKLHEIEKVLVVNHQDCGAYGGSSTFPNFAHEEEAYKQDMKVFREAILAKHSHLSVELYIALLEGGIVEV